MTKLSQSGHGGSIILHDDDQSDALQMSRDFPATALGRRGGMQDIPVTAGSFEALGMEPEFDAEAFDVCVEGARVGDITGPPDQAENFGAVAGLVGVLAKVPEEFVFR